MAYITNAPLSQTIRDQVDRVMARLRQGFDTYQHLRARRDRIERLEAMSDAELAARGITRDQIVAYVFRDRFCY